MTKEELAASLNGREYGSEITPDEERAAKKSGLVVLFGYSDDLAEFRGAINDEAGCYEGGEFLLSGGRLLSDLDECDCRHAREAKARAETGAHRIRAAWCFPGNPDWSYETDIPHATFDVLEDGEPYCRGIVFELASVS